MSAVSAAVVMLLPREQCRSRRPADRGRVETVVAKSPGCELIESGRRDQPAECECLLEADVIQQDEDEVRGVFSRCRDLGPGRFRIFVRLSDLPFRMAAAGTGDLSQLRQIWFSYNKTLLSVSIFV